MTVFLSYARVDEEQVELLRRDIEDLVEDVLGPVWLDRKLRGSVK
jgi:hypothetical protein